jgi:hypothetical protein
VKEARGLWLGRFLILAALLAGVLGCGTEPERPAPLPPSSDTPAGAIARLVWAYEGRKPQEFSDLLTGDFRFEFSPAKDPSLVDEWPEGWLKPDEVISARNLFQGGHDRQDQYVAPAERIALALTQTTPAADLEAPDTVRFKVLVTGVELYAEIASGGPEPVPYFAPGNLHRLRLVRGDAGPDLAENQPADSAHWYIRSWSDETPPGGAVAIEGQSPGMNGTWGALKALYR